MTAPIADSSDTVERLAGVDLTVVDFLVRAAREFRRGGYVFTGFHWPVLAGQVAHALGGESFVQAFEAGAMTHGAGRIVPTSTTDYPAYGNALGYVGSTADILLAMARRFDRVVLDASNVDIRGRVNASYIGDQQRPTVRLPGGGGAADVAARARELVWLSGGPDVSRIQASVEHVTSAPGPQSLVRLHTRWGIAVLGDEPHLEEFAEVAGADEFVAHMAGLGVAVGSPTGRAPAAPEERLAAVAVLREAAERGYQVARRAFSTATSK
jgi:glutaconate CoA-transferase subunit B